MKDEESASWPLLLDMTMFGIVAVYVINRVRVARIAITE